MTEEIKDPMVYIWEKVPKTKEGFIHYLTGDIPYLYRNGFVDTNRFTFQQWAKAFDDCKQKDGSYLVSKDKFLSLKIYRYTGPVFKPFDAQKIREGEWTDEDLQKLFERSLKPSSTVTHEIFWKLIDTFKKKGSLKNGHLVIDAPFKIQLGYLVEKFPSPRRRLEKEVARLREERENQYRSSVQSRDSSVFVSGALASETKMDELQKLQGSAPLKKNQTPPLKISGPSLDIKKLRKPGKKISS